MALKMNTGTGKTDNAKSFVSKVFGPDDPSTKLADDLSNVGVEFSTSLYGCSASYQGKTSEVKLTASSVSLAEKKVTPVILQQNKEVLANWLKSLKQSYYTQSKVEGISIIVTTFYPNANLILALKTIRTISGCGLAEAKHLVEAVKQGTPQLLTTLSATTEESVIKDTVAVLKGAGFDVNVMVHDSQGNETAYSFSKVPPVVPEPSTSEPLKKKNTPVDTVIPLKDAKALGQKVKGTSAGSVYRCIALNERVKLAARIHKAGSISIRAEWQDALPTELEKLTAAGLGMKGSYASMHLDAGNVPFGRVIGAFVVGTGIKWQDAVLSGSELIVE